MLDQEIIDETAKFVKQTLEKEGSGHDWQHIKRVWNNSILLNKEEKADVFVVQIAALLHDIADWKLHEEKAGSAKAEIWLRGLEVDGERIGHVCDIIETISFKGKDAIKPMKTIEGKIVQDADRLDALGAIGIARCFVYSGYKGKPIYDPSITLDSKNYIENSRSNQGTAINHFYEKLLLLKDLMNTPTGKKIAEERHAFMEEYLKQFFKEWNAV